MWSWWPLWGALGEEPRIGVSRPVCLGCVCEVRVSLSGAAPWGVQLALSIGPQDGEHSNRLSLRTLSAAGSCARGSLFAL